MARPRKNNADYFSHDNNMRNDRKLKAVRALFGLDGYAVYCMLLESITEADLLYLKWDELEIEMISGDFGITADKLKEMVEYFVKVNLIFIDKKRLYCPQLDRRLAGVFEKRTKNLENLRNENGVSVPKTGVSDAESTQSKVKKSKVKNNKKEYAENVKLTESEHKKLIDKYGDELTGKMIEKLDNYKGSTGKKYKSDYRTILNWVADDVLKSADVAELVTLGIL